LDRADCAGRTLAALYDAGKLADLHLAPESALGRRQARERYEAAADYLAMHFAAVAGAGGPQRAKIRPVVRAGDDHAARPQPAPGSSVDRTGAALYEMPPEVGRPGRDAAPGAAAIRRDVSRRVVKRPTRSAPGSGEAGQQHRKGQQQQRLGHFAPLQTSAKKRTHPRKRMLLSKPLEISKRRAPC